MKQQAYGTLPGVGRASASRLVTAALCLMGTIAVAAPPPLPSGLGDVGEADGGARTGEGGPALPPGLADGDDDPAPSSGPRSDPDGPALPPGLGDKGTVDGPPLPSGLGGKDADSPSLPPGLGGGDAGGTRAGADAVHGKSPLADIAQRLDGFVETRFGVRTGDDPYQDDLSIAEARTQLAAQWTPGGSTTVRVVGDLIYDAVEPDRSLDLETGRGWLDLREASLVFRPVSFADVKVGRQILTWGTGDLIFLNDLFPKDFRAFFIGRDDEYLKAPSDAVRVSTFFDLVNLDVAWTPRFDPDRAIDGTRLSFFNPLLGRLSGEDAMIRAALPDDWIDDDELALRAYRNLGAWETALYFYEGFWKSPAGFDDQGRALHPALRVYGASVRGPLRGGIASAEVAHYDSRDDQSGRDPFVQNGETRFLLGYEREVATNLTLGLQYFGQRTTEVDALIATLPAGFRVPDEFRHTLTVRLTRLAMNQNLTLSLFKFWSPNDDDGHLRLRASYKVTDAWRVEGGANLFYGPDEQTFFGQLKGNDNVFVGVRRSF